MGAPQETDVFKMGRTKPKGCRGRWLPLETLHFVNCCHLVSITSLWTVKHRVFEYYSFVKNDKSIFRLVNGLHSGGH